jgi:hypothetical protein
MANQLYGQLISNYEERLSALEIKVADLKEKIVKLLELLN